MRTAPIAALAVLALAACDSHSSTAPQPAHHRAVHRSFVQDVSSLLPGYTAHRMNLLASGICLDLGQTMDGSDASAMVQTTFGVSGRKADRIVRIAATDECRQLRYLTT